MKLRTLSFILMLIALFWFMYLNIKLSIQYEVISKEYTDLLDGIEALQATASAKPKIEYQLLFKKEREL